MNEHPIPGPMTMVKVDGAKIKYLRETQGLTQLYLATAVQVTTDTISRWENKKYPTIKKENGLKLAEALNVDLEELLLPEEADDRGGASLDSPSTATLDSAPPSPPPAEPGNPAPAKRKLLLLFAGLALAVAIPVGWLLLGGAGKPQLFAERELPRHCIAGQPFPVLIRVSGISDSQPMTLIIKENLPANATVVKISPESSGGATKKDTVKWLKKVSGPTTFAYLVTLAAGNSDSYMFSGTASVSGDVTLPETIGGNQSISLGTHHWADSDGDNTISDDEILAVHDRYRDLQGIDIDIETIEAIWLGSGYSLNAKTKKLTIRE